MSKPFRWGPVRLDAEAVARLSKVLSSVTSLAPGGDPTPGGHVHLIASDGPREVVAEGIIARLVSADAAIVQLVYVDDETLRDDFPMLAWLEREGGAWRISRCEPLYAKGTDDPTLETVRAEVVVDKLAYLVRRAAENEGFAEHIGHIRAWHLATKRAWRLE